VLGLDDQAVLVIDGRLHVVTDRDARALAHRPAVGIAQRDLGAAALLQPIEQLTIPPAPAPQRRDLLLELARVPARPHAGLLVRPVRLG